MRRLGSHSVHLTVYELSAFQPSRSQGMSTVELASIKFLTVYTRPRVFAVRGPQQAASRGTLVSLKSRDIRLRIHHENHRPAVVSHISVNGCYMPRNGALQATYLDLENAIDDEIVSCFRENIRVCHYHHIYLTSS